MFSRVVRSRIQATLDKAPNGDQAGFRSGYSCDDHLLTIVMLIEKSSEYQLPLWFCAVDFQKAFDTVRHNALWRALAAQRVPSLYIHALASLYSSQVGQIKGRSISRQFSIGRGTKQGDPLSPPLFNSLLEDALAPVQEIWRKKGWGIQLGGMSLCNLRFADDILLIARTKR